MYLWLFDPSVGMWAFGFDGEGGSLWEELWGYGD
jgi:hypothetical protein